MDKILIEVIGQEQGLDEINKKLEDATKHEKHLVDQMKQLSIEREKEKVYAKTMEERLAAENKYAKAASETRKEIKENQKSIEALSNAQKKMQGEVVAKNTEKSFRQLRREIEEEIKTMEMLGQTVSSTGRTYEELVEEAGRLSDIQGDVQRSIKNIASDTRAFDTILEGTQAIAGGFSLAQGAMTLFGSESEEVQEVMMKLQALIAINTGLQQIQNATQKESNLLMGIASLQAKAKAAAEAAATKGTLKATIAQKAFNIVAKANPYVLLATALISVVGALYLFSSRTTEVSEKQKRLNEVNEKAIEGYVEQQTEIKNMVSLISKETTTMEQKRKIMQTLNEKYLDSNNQLKNTKELEEWLVNNADNFITAVGLKAKAAAAYELAVEASKKALLEQQKGDEEFLKWNEKFLLKLNSLFGEYGQQFNKPLLEAGKENKENAVKQEEDAATELLNLAEIFNQQYLELAKKLGLDLEGEQKRAAEKRKAEILKAQQDLANERLKAMQEGEQKEIASINKTLQERLSAIKGNSQAEIELRKQLEENAQQEILKVQKKYDDIRSKEDIDTEISVINARILQAEKGSETELELKKQLADRKAELDLLDAENSITNENLKAARIEEINAQLVADKEALDKGYADVQEKARQDQLDKEKEAAEKQLEQQKEYTAKQKELYKELYDQVKGSFTDFLSFVNEAETSRYQKQLDDLQKYYTTDAEEAQKNKNLKLISEEEYATKEEQLQNKIKDAEKKGKRSELLISQAEALGKVWQTYSVLMANPLTIPLAPLALAQIPFILARTGIQLAAINKYWKGRKGGTGEYALVGEHGPELMFVPNMASIMPAHDTVKALSGNNKMFERWNMPVMNPQLPVMPKVSQQTVNNFRNENSNKIDYDLIGKAVARNVKLPKVDRRPVNISINRGATTIEDGNTTTKNLNSNSKFYV